MSQNNPIQERIDQLLVKWTKATQIATVKIIRLLSAADEQDMMDTFFEYMLAIDTDQEDFVFVLESPLTDIEQYSVSLLEEVYEEIKRWNEATIPEHIPFETITWEPDYTLGSKENYAHLFLRNIEALNHYLIPQQTINFCMILRMPRASKKNATKWLEDLLKIDCAPNIIIGIQDTQSFPIYETIASVHPKNVHTIYPNLNMDNAMEELAGLGNPNAPETPYRTHLVKLMNAVKKRDANLVSIHSKACLDIALKLLEKDPNWLIQIVTVFTILYNDQVGYKAYDKAIYFATKANENAQLATQLIPPDMSFRLVGQTFLGRGALYAVKKKWDLALDDYIKGAEAYETCKDYLMQCEALRLTGWAYEKLEHSQKAIETYISAYLLLHKIPHDTLRGSTFPLVVQKVLFDTERQKQVSDAQLEKDMTTLYGENWEYIINQYGKAPKQQDPIYA